MTDSTTALIIPYVGDSPYAIYIHKVTSTTTDRTKFVKGFATIDAAKRHIAKHYPTATVEVEDD